jgi:hypothetical protein
MPEGTRLVRTILDVDESAQSLVFAGDVPEGATARLMKANFERLVDGAEGAARSSLQSKDAELAILVSCIGRKLVLKQRTEEEREQREYEESLDRDTERLKWVAAGWSTVELLIKKPDTDRVRDIRDRTGDSVLERIDTIIGQHR